MLIATLIATAFNSSYVNAEIINASHAAQIASDFLTTLNGNSRLKVMATGLSLRYTCYSSIDHVTPTYYVFVNERNGGWVIAAADDRAIPILGYCEGGNFDMEQLPCNMRSWINSYSEQIEHIQRHPELEPSQPGLRITSSLANISPMLTSSWGQSSPFNGQCPKVGYYRTYTGCVATAMAQVMYYHRYPVRECRAIPAYTSKGGISISALSAVEFDWDNMLSSYSYNYNTTQANAVAELMRYCGQSVEMNYGTSISTALFQTIPFALNYYFGYSESAKAFARDSSNEADWEQMVYDELAKGRPIIYSGYDSNSGSHAFVLDGYRDGMFHINWGWSGDYDSYWQLSALTPKSYNFSSHQLAVMEIHRDYADVNGDGGISIADVSQLIDILLGGNNDGYVAGDVNGDGTTSIKDVTILVDWLLSNGGNNNVGDEFTVNGVAFKMVKVEGGTFVMGATAEQGDDASLAEQPSHQVTLSSYYIGKTEVTQALWKAVMGTNPSSLCGPELPVGNVSWNDCIEFISRLNNLTGLSFRLPTEAEWEFAARGGNKSQGYRYAGSDDIDAVAWFYDNAQYSYGRRVAQKMPNELGIYDMSGNMYEWCSDYCAMYDSDEPQTNPQGPLTGNERVVRSGSWYSPASECRNSARSGAEPTAAYVHMGFRLAL